MPPELYPTGACPAAPDAYHVQEAARARINLDMAIEDLKLALCWARREEGRCHAEIHGLIAMTRMVVEKLRTPNRPAVTGEGDQCR